MNLDRIDLNLLVVLEAIYDKGGITRAAEALHVTQPAVSHALGRLRRLFDDPLFVRDGHAMIPTPLMRNLIDPLRRALRSLEVALNEVQHFDPAQARKRFTIGARDVLESTILPRLLRRVTEQAPGIDIASVNFNRRDAEADLLSGRLDMVMDAVLPESDAVHSISFMSNPLAVVMRRDHPAAAEPLTLAKYLRYGHILVTSRRTGPGFIDLELARHGQRRRIALRCQHYYAAWRVAAETDLMLTMPERLARLLNVEGENCILPLPLRLPTQEIYLYWHANAENDPGNRWLREQLIESFEASTA